MEPLLMIDANEEVVALAAEVATTPYPPLQSGRLELTIVPLFTREVFNAPAINLIAEKPFTAPRVIPELTVTVKLGLVICKGPQFELITVLLFAQANTLACATSINAAAKKMWDKKIRGLFITGCFIMHDGAQHLMEFALGLITYKFNSYLSALSGINAPKMNLFLQNKK
jgi:hypothetical protein